VQAYRHVREQRSDRLMLDDRPSALDAQLRVSDRRFACRAADAEVDRLLQRRSAAVVLGGLAQPRIGLRLEHLVGRDAAAGKGEMTAHAVIPGDTRRVMLAARLRVPYVETCGFTREEQPDR